MSLSYIYCPLTSCQVSAKSNVGKYQNFCGRTHTHVTFSGSSSTATCLKAQISALVLQAVKLSNLQPSNLQTIKPLITLSKPLDHWVHDIQTSIAISSIRWPKPWFLALFVPILIGFLAPWLLSVASGYFPLSEYAISGQSNQPNSIKLLITWFLALWHFLFFHNYAPYV